MSAPESSRFNLRTLRRGIRHFATASLVCGLSVPIVFVSWLPAPIHAESPVGAEAIPQLSSGIAVGERVPQFYARAVTGPLMNRSICYVCRYGDRPVAMVLTRKVGPELRPLVRNIDRLCEQHRAGGLRSFGVYVTGESFPAISSVQTFAFNNHVTMPMTIGTEAAEAGQHLHADAAVTVVLYHKQTVVARYALRTEELDVPHYTPIIEKLKAFAAERAPTPADPSAETAE